MFRRTLFTVGAVSLVAACTDSPTAPKEQPRVLLGSAQASPLERYSAMGTSISMGTASDGVYAASQAESWPAQLARLAGVSFTQPYIDFPGCRSPLASPLATGRRLSGEPAGAPLPTLSCAPLQAGVTLPTQNVAINAATVIDALRTTPESTTDLANKQLYSRVLPPNATQLAALLSTRPAIASIEFGGNEVLGARSGVAIPGQTIMPVSVWEPNYRALVKRVGTQVPRLILVGLIDDVASFPSFRRGDELWNDRLAFLGAFHVAINGDCQGSQNLIFVPVRVPVAVATGAARKAAGLPPFDLFCSDAGTGQQDFVLTPSDVSLINGQLAQMNVVIRDVSKKHRTALFYLQDLYGRSDVKGPFSVVQMMTAPTPYGSLISLDGIHPSAAGQTVLAGAAAAAVNARYGWQIPQPSPFIAVR
jgi:hypothetical protein